MKKRVAVIIPSLNGGGAERIAGLLSLHLENKYDVFVIVFDDNDIVYSYGGKLVPFREVIDYEKKTRSEVLQILKKKYNIDISISFMDWVNYYNLLSRGQDKILISSRNILAFHDPRIYLDRFRAKMYYPLADHIVSCSNGIAQELIKDYAISPDLVTTIYNYIDVEDIRDKATEKVEDDISDYLGSSDYFINMGRLHGLKNQATIISEFARYYKERSSTKLLILGSGEEQNNLNGQIRDLGLEHCIRIIPYRKNPFNLLKRAKAFILTSFHEGLPNVLLEAMAIGVPIISTDCLSGPRELLNDECDYKNYLGDFVIGKRGILLGNRDRDYKNIHLVDAMNWIDDNPDIVKQMIQEQIEYMNHYSIDSITNKWIDVIENMPINKNAKSIREIEAELLRSTKKRYIYGAGEIAHKIYKYFNEHYGIDGFIVTREGNEKDIDGIPIYEYDKALVDDPDVTVIVGVGILYLNEVTELLMQSRCKIFHPNRDLIFTQSF